MKEINEIKNILKDKMTERELDITEDFLNMILTVKSVRGFETNKDIILDGLDELFNQSPLF